jgi:hypothetical protein
MDVERIVSLAPLRPSAGAHFDTRIPEAPQENEKKYLPARQAVGALPAIFPFTFARANEYIACNGRRARYARPLCTLFEKFIRGGEVSNDRRGYPLWPIWDRQKS